MKRTATVIRHRWPVWHAALRVLGMAISALPRAYRYRAAVFLARLFLPVVRTTRMFRERRTNVIETPGEIVLYSILNALGRAGIEFDPQLHVAGFELLERSVESGKGVLLIGARTMLGHAFVRYLADHAYRLSLVSPDPYALFGRTTLVPTISPGLKYFLEVRERLRKGEIVIATPDRGPAPRPRTLTVKTREGTVHFAPPLIEVAMNAKAELLFMRTWLKGDVINVELSPGSLPGDADANAIALRYADFVQRHIVERDTRAKRRG